MADLSYVAFRLAEPPKPGLFLSWCLSSRFSWIRNAAQKYHNKQIADFRAQEVKAIIEAKSISDTVKAKVDCDSSLTALKMLRGHIGDASMKMRDQICAFPEVHSILTLTFNDVHERIKSTKVYSYFFKPPAAKPVEPKSPVADYNGAIEIRTPKQSA